MGNLPGKRFVALALSTAAAVACGPRSHEVVVTRDQVGDAWPLEVNSATVICGGASGTELKLGPERYALDDAALARGLPDAKQVAAEIPVDRTRPEIGTWPGNVSVLRSACDEVAALD